MSSYTRGVKSLEHVCNVELDSKHLHLHLCIGIYAMNKYMETMKQVKLLFTKDINLINTKMFIIKSFEYMRFEGGEDEKEFKEIKYNIRILNLVKFDNVLKKYIRFHLLFTSINIYILKKPPVSDLTKNGLPNNIKSLF